METKKIYRAIKLYPDNLVVVSTIGPIGDGSDNTVEQFKNAQVISEYRWTEIITRGMLDSQLAIYPTKEIIMIVTNEQIEHK